MTFLTTRYRLARPLSPRELERLGHLSTVYGIRGISSDGGFLVVEYDASRCHVAEVMAAVRHCGISVHPEVHIPAGAFDSTGQFKDFAWPTTGISPVNQNVK